MSTGDVSSGMPAGPAGCWGAVLVIAFTLVMIGLFIAAVWWCLKDVGAA